MTDDENVVGTTYVLVFCQSWYHAGIMCYVHVQYLINFLNNYVPSSAGLGFGVTLDNLTSTVSCSFGEGGWLSVFVSKFGKCRDCAIGWLGLTCV